MNQRALGVGAISVYGDAEDYRDRHHDAEDRHADAQQLTPTLSPFGEQVRREINYRIAERHQSLSAMERNLPSRRSICAGFSGGAPRTHQHAQPEGLYNYNILADVSALDLYQR